MDRFWVLFLSLAVLVPLSAAGYFYYLDNPFDGKPASLNEGGFVWHPSATSGLPSAVTQYSRAKVPAREARLFLIQGNYQSLEAVIATSHSSDYTPWYLGSWMAFYFEIYAKTRIRLPTEMFCVLSSGSINHPEIFMH